ncbi:hypothetical protein BD626DRAFT_495062 [Schizophyllum amplum]|uniref:Uncharacterized protein n=1 Tax=Schizophyllum amplum TaxID=97359 RepID=A0A550CFV5_9AGAR|nr:hypothetical protein BD626DRAFT_495062 [Auriculariopsis ampla]
MDRRRARVARRSSHVNVTVLNFVTSATDTDSRLASLSSIGSQISAMETVGAVHSHLTGRPSSAHLIRYVVVQKCLHELNMTGIGVGPQFWKDEQRMTLAWSLSLPSQRRHAGNPASDTASKFLLRIGRLLADGYRMLRSFVVELVCTPRLRALVA